MKQTSIMAYEDINADGSAMSQRERVHNLVKHSYGLTRQDLSKRLGIPINAVCGRTKELLKMGLIRETGIAINPATNKANAVLRSW